MEVDLIKIETGKIDIWMNYFKTIIEKANAELEKPCKTLEEADIKEKNIYNKLQGTACQASYRLLQKFGNKKLYSKKAEFAEYYCQNLCEPMLEAHLYLISKKDSFIGRKSLYFSFRYISL